jgi:hypothetical protein
MPVMEPLGASWKGVELIAASTGGKLVDSGDYSAKSSAEDDQVLDSQWTGMCGRLTRTWSMIRRRALITLLVLWLDPRSVLRLWFIGLIMSVIALFTKSLSVPLLGDRG